MTSFRQIEANRRNATRSTGPNTEEGKRRSRRNAVRHGLCAETVIENVEDIDDYRAFETAIIADYDAQTAVERELVLRLASLLWRIRRATSIETGLLQIQAEILRDRRNACELAAESERKPENFAYRVIEGPRPSVRKWSNGSRDNDRTNTADHPCDKVAVSPDNPPSTSRELTYCFLRLANLDNGAFDRLGRYEAALWRQIVQMLFALQTLKH